MLAILTLPACVVVGAGAPLLLDLFGPAYSRHGTDVLILMAFAAVPVAALNWLVTILRLLKQLVAVALSNGVYAVAICGLTWVLAPRGLSFVGVAWLGGSLIGAAVAAIAVAFGSGVDSKRHNNLQRDQSPPAVHRRSRSGRRRGHRKDGQAPEWQREEAGSPEPVGTHAEPPGRPIPPWPNGYRQTVLEGPGDVDTITAPDQAYIDMPVVDVPAAGVTMIDVSSFDGPEDDKPEIEGPSRTTTRRRWPLVAAAMVILAGISLATPAGRHQWALSLIRQPTPYTVLSFENAGHLPTTVPAEGRLDLTFSVTNHEGRDVRYRYLVTNASSGQIPVVLQRGILDVPVGVRQTKSVSVVPTCQSSPCRVQVSLPGPAESIDVQVALHDHSS